MRAAAGAALAVSFVIGTAGVGRSAVSTAPVAVCVDSSSPSATVDENVARASFRATGGDVTIVHFDGGSGIADRYFGILARKQCALIMGFPVDLIDADPPRGLDLTTAYVHTGYVLATLQPQYLTKLPPNALIALGAATSPNFYVVGALGGSPNLKADSYQTQELALDALFNHTDPAAMVWYLSLRRYVAAHPAPKVRVAPLAFPHARWDIAALYDPETNADVAKTFERGLSLLRGEHRLDGVTGPTFPE